MPGSVGVGKKESGFTFVEVVVIFAIIGILGAMAVPRFSVWLPNYRLTQAARDVFSRFQLARITAIKRNTNCTITFNQSIGTGTYDYVAFIDTDNDLEYDAGEEVIAQVLWADYKSISFDASQGGGDGVLFSPNDEGNPAIAFQPNGLPTNNSGSLGMGTVFLKNTNNKTKSIILSSAGNISID